MPFASIEIVPIVAIAGPLVMVVLIMFSANWRKAKVAEYRAIMVQNMLDKGFTPDDIERVLRANDAGTSKLAGKETRRRSSEYVR